MERQNVSFKEACKTHEQFRWSSGRPGLFVTGGGGRALVEGLKRCDLARRRVFRSCRLERHLSHKHYVSF